MTNFDKGAVKLEVNLFNVLCKTESSVSRMISESESE